MEHKRRIFLINKKFQFRFSFYVCSWIFALSLVYPLMMYNLFDFFIKYMESRPIDISAIVAIRSTRSDLIWVLIALQILFLLITLLISMFMSHRIAGPLYKLNKHLIDVKDGKLIDDLKFRKNDHFKELADSYNLMSRGVKFLIEQKSVVARKAITQVEKATRHADANGKALLEEALKTLKQI